MTYTYECRMIDCKCRNEAVDVDKPMAESDREEKCECCGEVMQRIFTSPAVKTLDGFKS